MIQHTIMTSKVTQGVQVSATSLTRVRVVNRDTGTHSIYITHPDLSNLTPSAVWNRWDWPNRREETNVSGVTAVMPSTHFHVGAVGGTCGQRTESNPTTSNPHCIQMPWHTGSPGEPFNCDRITRGRKEVHTNAIETNTRQAQTPEPRSLLLILPAVIERGTRTRLTQ